MIPDVIRNDSSTRELLLTWAAGEVQALPHSLLRASCPCAFCRARRFRGEVIPLEQERRITALHPQGYGLQIVFDDGHDRGIFPWPYLAGLTSQRSVSAV